MEKSTGLTLEEALPRTGVRLVFDDDYTRLPGLLQAKTRDGGAGNSESNQAGWHWRAHVHHRQGRVRLGNMSRGR